MTIRTVTRSAMTLFAAAGLALSAPTTAFAADTPDGTNFYNADRGGRVNWVDNSGGVDRDDLFIWDGRSDSHGVWVRVEHPEGQFTKVNNIGAGHAVTMFLPNLLNGYRMYVTICLSEQSEPIDGTCLTHTITE